MPKDVRFNTRLSIDGKESLVVALTYEGVQAVGVGVMSVFVLMFIISSLFVYAAKISIFRKTAKQDCPFYD